MDRQRKRWNLLRWKQIGFLWKIIAPANVTEEQKVEGKKQFWRECKKRDESITTGCDAQSENSGLELLLFFLIHWVGGKALGAQGRVIKWIKINKVMKREKQGEEVSVEGGIYSFRGFLSGEKERNLFICLSDDAKKKEFWNLQLPFSD